MRVVSRRFLPLFALFGATIAIATAQTTVRIEFPDASSREVWMADSMPDGPPTGSIKTEAKSIDVPAEHPGPQSKVFVWDRKSGNLAFKAKNAIKGVWKLQPADFKFVAVVHIKLEYDDKPVAAAMVQLKDKARSASQVLDKTSEGKLDFYAVVPGQIAVSATYRSGGKTQRPFKQVFQVDLSRSKPEPEFTLSVPDEVETVTVGSATEGAGKPDEGEKRKGKGAGKEPKAASEEPSRPSVVIQLALALLILGGGAYGIYVLMQYLNKNSHIVKGGLQKMGVQIPDEPEDDQASPMPAMPATPPPPEKIILTDAPIPDPAPAPIPTPMASVAPVSAAIDQPRLVRDNGQAFMLVEGPNPVGREAGAGIALVGEDSVSRRHAEVVRTGSRVAVKDLGSTNGTYVNGVKVVGEAALTVGDTVQFGAVRLRVEG